MADQTAEHVKAHADVMELEAVDFLDSHGQPARTRLGCLTVSTMFLRAALQSQRVTTVRLKFIDGAEFRITAAEWDKLERYSFRLRPARNDA